jgi:hypothetical protein
MTDRPIIFSGPMVNALLDGRKLQTRRLASSPLRRVEIGDRLYVRESWSHSGVGVWTIADARRQIDGRPIYAASEAEKPPQHWWPSIHMPRNFSRLTLIVTDVRRQRLTAIGGHDARCEGVERLPEGGGWKDYSGRFGEALSAVESFATLWDSLHSKVGERWQDRPDVIALTFEVIPMNIDRLPAEATHG